MKKFFTFLAAAVAALCITSCSKELVDGATLEEAFSVAEMEIDITVGGFNGPDTKAVKSSWNSGDQINIWYDNHFTRKPDLILVYDGTKWSVDAKASVSGAAPKASGTLNALYVEGGLSTFEVYQELTYDDDDWCSFSMNDPSSKIDGYTPAPGMPLYTYVDRAEYTFSSNKMTANLGEWLFSYANNVQIVITGLPSGNWALKCDKFLVASSFDLYYGSVSGSTKASGTYTFSTTNKDGNAFMFSCIDKNQDLVFTLVNTYKPDEKYTFSTTGKSFDINRLQSFKIPYSKFLPAPTAVDLGLSVKWASFNIGATKAEDYGYYFAWGETSRKINYHWGEEGWYKWGVLDSNASPKYGMTKYTATVNGGDGLKTLQPDDDPATANLGAKWRTPTVNEIIELLDDTKCEWTWDATKKGYTVKGLKTGNSIFLPAAGGRYGSGIGSVGTNGYYWSSSVIVYDPRCASSFSFDMNRQIMINTYRCYGYSVRAVTE